MVEETDVRLGNGELKSISLHEGHNVRLWSRCRKGYLFTDMLFKSSTVRGRGCPLNNISDSSSFEATTLYFLNMEYLVLIMVFRSLTK